MAGESGKKNPLGVVGGYVIEHVTQLRKERRLSYKDLSDRLGQLGRPIPTLGLSRIEKGKRRVDADDLVALATVLEISPGSLLLPCHAETPEPDMLARIENLERQVRRLVGPDAP